MELRILRVWHDVLGVPMELAKFGAPNPMRREAFDTLQYRMSPENDWRDVPIVEEALHEQT